MPNHDRPANDETDRARLEVVGAGVESEEPVEDKVLFIDTLDAETRAQLDEVLERSTMLARSVIAALKNSSPSAS